MINLVQQNHFEKTPDSYFVGRNDNSKVKKIVLRIE